MAPPRRAKRLGLRRLDAAFSLAWQGIWELGKAKGAGWIGCGRALIRLGVSGSAARRRHAAHSTALTRGAPVVAGAWALECFWEISAFHLHSRLHACNAHIVLQRQQTAAPLHSVQFTQ